jgi:diguanylate cyclase (GGDEF)-like protein
MLFMLVLVPVVSPHQGFVFILLLPLLFLAIILFHLLSSLHHRARYDPLLHIYNRDYFQAILQGQAHLDLGQEYCVALCDLDHFKSINDRAGHQTGDLVLEKTAQTIRRLALPKGTTCRYGGEEIVIFFRHSSMEDAYPVCEKIRKAVGQLDFKSGRRKIKITVSIGLATNQGQEVDLAKVVAAADKAVYQAKEGGRNKVVKG